MADESILARIERRGGTAPRLRLRSPDGAEAVPAATPTERYEVLGEIARGGIGVVLKARDADLGRDVAMKVLRDDHLGNPELTQRFVEEAQIGGQLQHPGVVPVYELGLTAGERPFFTMRLVKGRSFAEVLAGRESPAADRRRMLTIFLSVCQTMAYAHSRGVIHRDLKPSNILIGAFGEVQVVDFGFAKVLPRGGVADEKRARSMLRTGTKITTARSVEGSDSLDGSVFGTPAYMPPEQALGMVDDLDERSDVFALGAILCEILTGKPPYAGAGLAALAQAATGPTEDVAKALAASGADEDLLALARAALAPLPKDRPRHAGVLAEAVAAHLAGVEERAHRSALAAIAERERAARARDRADEAKAEAEEHRRWRRHSIVIGAALVLAILAGTGGYLWVAAGKTARARAAASTVDEAMREAIARRTDDLPAALAAAERACALSKDELVDAPLRGQAEALRATTRTLLDAHRAKEAVAARDRAMVETLENLRFRAFDRDPKGLDAAYAAAFRDYGIDVEKLAPEQAATDIRRKPIALELSIALDAWSSHRRAKKLTDPGPAPLTDVARLADPDEWRNRLRDALPSFRRERLMNLAETADAAALPAQSLLLLGTALADAGERAKAIDVLTAAVFEHPDDFWLHYDLAALYLRELPPRNARARRHSTPALALRPDHACAQAMHGSALLAAGEREEALYWLRQSIAGKPEHASHLVVLGAALGEGGEDREAEELLRRAVAMEPESGEPWAALGGLQMKRERHEEAEKAFLEAARLDAKDACSRTNLAWYRRRAGEKAEAIEWARKAVEADPTHALSQLNLGTLLAHSGSAKEGLAEIMKAVALAPEEPSYREELANWLYRTGDAVRAQDEAREALRLGGDRYVALNLLSWLCLMSEDPRVKNLDKALNYAKRAVAVAPDEPHCLGTLALVRLRRGQPEKAKEAAEKSIPLHTAEKGRAGDRLVLALTLAKLGDLAGAKEQLRLAAEWLDASGLKDDDLARLREEAAAACGGAAK